jgi:hypothetical protein
VRQPLPPLPPHGIAAADPAELRRRKKLNAAPFSEIHYELGRLGLNDLDVQRLINGRGLRDIVPSWKSEARRPSTSMYKNLGSQESRSYDAVIEEHNRGQRTSELPEGTQGPRTTLVSSSERPTAKPRPRKNSTQNRDGVSMGRLRNLHRQTRRVKWHWKPWKLGAQA